MEPTTYMQALGQRARAASGMLAGASTQQKNQTLTAIAQALVTHTPQILEANAADLAVAEQNGVRPAMQDRLRLDAGRVKAMADALGEIIMLPDPVGEVISGRRLPNGLEVTQRRVPLGVVGMIYESRPNVTVDAAALCLKSGNACILRGGKEAIHSNKALAAVMAGALEQSGLPADCVLLVEDASRETATAMMRLNGLIDVLIPRGGAGLIQSVVQNATLPVIETGVGNCHLYIDKTADLQMAARLLENAKCSRPSVCNAVETLLVHRAVAEEALPLCAAALAPHGVELRGCPETARILGAGVLLATDEDYATEFCDYILAIRVVDSLEEAIGHIARYGTGHSEAIVTRDYDNMTAFTGRVDAAAVYVNASTRFTDGQQMGLGAEIGISTQKLHVRGPMGLQALTTTKYLVLGQGQVRV